MAAALSWPLSQPLGEVFQIRPFQTDNPNAHLLRLLHACRLEVMHHCVFAVEGKLFMLVLFVRMPLPVLHWIFLQYSVWVSYFCPYVLLQGLYVDHVHIFFLAFNFTVKEQLSSCQCSHLKCDLQPLLCGLDLLVVLGLMISIQNGKNVSSLWCDGLTFYRFKLESRWHRSQHFLWSSLKIGKLIIWQILLHLCFQMLCSFVWVCHSKCEYYLTHLIVTMSL